MNDTSRRNRSRAWVEVPVADNGEAIVAAMTEAGVEFVFFTSGSEIGFYQEAIAKAEAQGRRAPKLISVTHEHANLNAARAYSYAIGRACDAGRCSRQDAAAAILFGADRATKMCLEAIQALGGNGYINDYAAGRLLRDAKLYEIGAGTQEIRRMLIGREIYEATA